MFANIVLATETLVVFIPLYYRCLQNDSLLYNRELNH